MLLLGLAATTTACRVRGAAAKWAAQASDSVDVVQAESAMLVGATENVDPAMTGDEAALAAAEGARTFWQPEGCLTAEVTTSTVTYTLDDCTGPYGLVHVTGVAVVEYARQGDGIGYTTTAEGLEINGAVVDIDNQGVYRRDGSLHTITGSVSGRGVGPRGNELTRSGNRTVTWDDTSGCITLDGLWMTSVERISWATTVSDFERCPYSCPESGGSIRWENDRDTLTLSYDGSNRAAWETGKGRSGTVRLFCD